MLRITSRTALAALGVACLLALASPASAQKVKSSSKASVRARAGVARAGGARMKSAPRARSSSISRKLSHTRPTPQRRWAGNPNNNVRVDRKANGVRTRKRTAIKSGKAKTITTRQPKVYRVASRKGTSVKARNGGTTFTKRGRTVLDVKRGTGKVDREGYANTFRVRQPIDRSVREPAVRHPGYRPHTRHRYDHHLDGFGHTYWYDGGFHRGYHLGFRHGYYYGHHHYYGPHLVFGFHYGGFGFYHDYWHFAIVIGAPIVVYRPYYYYYPYRWWDGRAASLVTWDRAAEAYRADYTFGANSCVMLWIATNDDTDYKINVDPAYWNARNPGDLYAALWSELEQNGRLEIEDENGVIHVFPAGTIRQIEATACR